MKVIAKFIDYLKQRKKIVALIAVLAFINVGFVTYKIHDDFEISKNLEIFIRLFRELNANYVDEINPGELIKKAIDSMLESLDPYTNYIPESEIEDYKLMTTGQYGGIGALIQQHGDNIVISEPYENYPAYKSGLRAGDIILEVNGESTKGKKVADVSSILKGSPNSKVVLTIKRPYQEKPFKVEIQREEIKIKNVSYYTTLDENIGYIKLTGFTQGASKEVRSAFMELKNQKNIKSLILDLRGNGGGLLNEAISIVSLFVPQNTLVVKTKGKLSDSNKDYKTYESPVDTEIPLVVLIDGASASASEIVAGSLQDLDRAVIIGNQSFGKGLVQNIITLNYNTRLKVTIAKYYIPSGRCIQSIDYSKKDSTGKGKTISDSLKTTFYTRNGRPVKDAGGIIPDIVVSEEELAKITASLVTKNLIFDFATHYYYKNSSIPPANQLKLTNELYNEFIEFLKDKDYDYVTESEQKLKELEEVTKKEKYFDNIKPIYSDLEKKISHNKQEDLQTFKNQIWQILGAEIASRYYFQNGRIEFSLNYDKDIEQSKLILNNLQQYNNILKKK